MTILNEQYERNGRSFRISRVAGGFRVMTLPEFAPDIVSMMGARDTNKLSRAALETLAIVAYQQPVTRATLEADPWGRLRRGSQSSDREESAADLGASRRTGAPIALWHKQAVP